MPELPEVETIVSELAPRVAGKTADRVDVIVPTTIAHAGPEQFESQLVGERIERIWRRGKHIVMDLSSGNKLVVHLRMTGRLLLREKGDAADKYVRVVIGLDSGQELRLADARRFARMSIVDPEHFERLSAALGPEPLGEEFTPETLEGIVNRRGGRIKAVLLDQRNLVGLGNIYVDEALFEAGIHPAAPTASLSRDDIKRLFLAVRRVLSAGVADRGTTFDSYLDAFGKPGGHQHKLQVYRRAGKPCPRCSAAIDRIVVGGRGTHFCPKCQPLTHPLASETALPSRMARRRPG